MKRNCNLELRLVTPCVFFHASDYKGRYHPSILDRDSGSPKKKQQLTIFYNGVVASYDSTELQARAIISLASREMEEKSKNNSPKSETSSPVVLNSPVYSPTTGLSMKRSLQRFLENRKTRVQSISPYPITGHH